jgi:hypothetical protein
MAQQLFRQCVLERPGPTLYSNPFYGSSEQVDPFSRTTCWIPERFARRLERVDVLDGGVWTTWTVMEVGAPASEEYVREHARDV